MAYHNDFGNEAELLARNYLVQKGYAILDCNWHSGHKEIDIIARDKDLLVIVEVKARKQSSLLRPEEAVDERKMLNLVRATDAYVRYRQLNIGTRFDIITVVPNLNNGYDINHIIDAFRPSVNMR